MSDVKERQKNDKLEISVNNLSNDVKLIQSNIDEQGRRLTWFMAHSDAIQEQIQESLQRQLDQNQEQHKEMMAVFKSQNEASNEQMKYFLSAAESRIDDIVKKQEIEDVDRNNRISVIEKDITEIKEAPLKSGSDTWKAVKLIAITAVVTAVIMSGVVLINGFIGGATGISMPIEAKE